MFQFFLLQCNVSVQWRILTRLSKANAVPVKNLTECSFYERKNVMECKDFEPSIIQDNENEYINISKAFSSSLVEKADASIALNSFVPINRVAEAKGLKSNRSLRLEINKPESK